MRPANEPLPSGWEIFYFPKEGTRGVVNDSHRLIVHGLFENDDAHRRYCESLAAQLNGSAQPPAVGIDAAVRGWIERRRKQLSKQGITGGHYIADLCLLEEVLDDCLKGTAETNPGVCATCNDRGEIGGFVNAESGYQSDPCPDCRPVEVLRK